MNSSISDPLESFNPDKIQKPEDYTGIIGKDKVEQLKKLGGKLEGMGWTNVNSTLIGGGVAEILNSAIPLARGLGIDAHWYVIKGQEQFFKVTKKFHNLLQGVDQSISLEEIFGAYLDTIDQNAKNTFIASDLVVIHDPQPAALIMNGMIYGNMLWRCHIDTSDPNPLVWRFLLPYINHTSGAIFTMKEFVGPGLQIPTYEIAPSIDPLAPKNHQYTMEEAKEVLSDLFHESNIDPERPIIAAISRYDVHKNQKTVIQAFKALQKQRKMNPPPYLVFLGNTAADDPEGDRMLEELKNIADDDPDIVFWVNVPDNNRVVGALMKYARAFVHVSTREGFGLVVTEALWQGTPVIGSRIGGIVKQVLHEETGYLVEPRDSGTIAEYMGRLIDDRSTAEAMGEKGRELVRNNFLIPELVRKYLVLLEHYTGQNHETPDFRLNELTYRELLNAMSFKNPAMTIPGFQQK